MWIIQDTRGYCKSDATRKMKHILGFLKEHAGLVEQKNLPLLDGNIKAEQAVSRQQWHKIPSSNIPPWLKTLSTDVLIPKELKMRWNRLTWFMGQSSKQRRPCLQLVQIAYRLDTPVLLALSHKMIKYMRKRRQIFLVFRKFKRVFSGMK